ncbi:hypothetical protein LTR66_004789 [Elasticomyces elasticus]|nr:hypothetical protein LTR50_001607 [Elasticomyces elasticus]KAK4995373.1 hypothetical protein LTR66_004789 [Elasticomyces elasticus]
MSDRPYITCHVLDTTTGKPAAGMTVTLTLLSPQFIASPRAFTSITNTDGRVTGWGTVNGDPRLAGLVLTAKRVLKQGEQIVWSLKFDTGSYFGQGNTFWPEVELKFFVKPEEEHYHVPLLLSPWSFTTYRGS